MDKIYKKLTWIILHLFYAFWNKMLMCINNKAKIKRLEYYDEITFVFILDLQFIIVIGYFLLVNVLLIKKM